MSREKQKEVILQKLRDAGLNGLSKSKLRITKSSEQAFQELLRDKEIRNLGSKARPRYVLKEYYNPLESAYNEIERFTSILQKKQNELIPFTLTTLRNKLPPGCIREKTDEAIEFLMNEKKLLKIKIGRGTCFLHVSSIAPYLPFEVSSRLKREDMNIVEIDRNKVLTSYEKIRKQKGFSNIEIHELQQDLAVPMEKLKSFLLEESRSSRAVFSSGDWSLSSEETRSGAIYLDGKPYLLIRFL